MDHLCIRQESGIKRVDSDWDRSKHSQCENPLNELAGHEGMKSVSSDAMIERNLKKILKAFLPHYDVLYDSVHKR